MHERPAANAILASDNHMKLHHTSAGDMKMCDCEWAQIAVVDDAPLMTEEEIEVGADRCPFRVVVSIPIVGSAGFVHAILALAHGRASSWLFFVSLCCQAGH